MNRFLQHIVSLLLVPCLLGSPIPSIASLDAKPLLDRQSDERCSFETQALAELLVSGKDILTKRQRLVALLVGFVGLNVLAAHGFAQSSEMIEKVTVSPEKWSAVQVLQSVLAAVTIVISGFWSERFLSDSSGPRRPASHTPSNQQPLAASDYSTVAFDMPDEESDLELPKIIISVTDMDAHDVKVRLKMKKEAKKPEHLYQWLPLSALSLIATLPRGARQVSIPHERALYQGFNIQRDKPSFTDGFVIDYVLNEASQLYVAASFHYKDDAKAPPISDGRFRTIEENFTSLALFHEFAKLKIIRLVGWIEPVEGRYAYYAPSWERWRTIVRDGGHTEGYSDEGSSLITEELLQESRQGRLPSSGGSSPGGVNLAPAGLIYRIPVYTSGSQPHRRRVDVFSRIEVTLDPVPTPESQWIPYEEYQRIRASRSRRPEAILPDFQDWLEQTSRAWGVQTWLFSQGMLFKAFREWWGRFYLRLTDHEGGDLVKGLNAQGEVVDAKKGFPVFAVADGEAVHLYKDFMAKSLIVRYSNIANEFGDAYHSIHVHFQPIAKFARLLQHQAEGLVVPVKKGELLGYVDKDPGKAPATPFHHHYSEAWMPGDIEWRKMNPDSTWDRINPNFTQVYLVDPFERVSRFKWVMRQDSDYPLEFWPSLKVGIEMMPEAEGPAGQAKKEFYDRIVDEMGLEFTVVPDFPPWYLPLLQKELKLLDKGWRFFVLGILKSMPKLEWWKTNFGERPDPLDFIDKERHTIVTIAANFRLPWSIKPRIREAVKRGAAGILVVSGGHPVVKFVRRIPGVNLFLLDSLAILKLAREMKDNNELPENFRIMAVDDPNELHGPDVVDRVKTKLHEGAKTILTQPEFLPDRFAESMAILHREGLTTKADFLVGIPLIASPDNLRFRFRHAGIPLSEPAALDLLARVEKAWSEGKKAFDEFSLAYTRELIARMIRIPGVAGCYLMPMRRWKGVEQIPPAIKPELLPDYVTPPQPPGIDIPKMPKTPPLAAGSADLGLSIQPAGVGESESRMPHLWRRAA